jgi:hypothetical protein
MHKTTLKQLVRRGASWAMLALFIFPVTVLLAISSAAPVSAYEFVEGYYNPASSQIIPGMYVSKVNADGLVVPTKISNADSALGVASEENGGLLTLTDSKSNVFVATSGTLPVFITDMAGEIHEGDNLSASVIPGVLKKTSDDDSYVLGVARETYTKDKTENTKSLELTSDRGTKSTVRLGLVSIDIKRFANPGKVAKNPVQRIGEAIVRKPVPLIQVIFGGAFFLISVVSILVLVGTAVRSSITSIGRNPLAKKSILRGLYQILLLAALILITGLAGTYIILWI